MAINENSILPVGMVLPLSNAAGEFLLPEAASSQDPYAAQRAQTEAALKQAYEAGPAAYKAEESKLNALHMPWYLDVTRLATGALGLILIVAGAGLFAAKVTVETKERELGLGPIRAKVRHPGKR